MLLRADTATKPPASPVAELAQPAELLVEKPPAEKPPETVRVLLHFKDDLAPLEKLGFKKTSVLGNIAAGDVALDDLEQVAAHPNVVSIESGRPLEAELDVSAVATKVTALRSILDLQSIHCRGKGVIIGIIDSGLDFAHPCFCDPTGKQTRVIALWDQNPKVHKPPDSIIPLSQPVP